MFILLLNNSNELKFFSNLCFDFTIHMKKILRLFAFFKGFLKLLLNFTYYCFELLPFVNFGDLFREYVNSWLFENPSWCIDLMSIDKILWWKARNNKLICGTLDKVKLIKFFCYKRLRLNYFFCRESKQLRINLKKGNFDHSKVGFINEKSDSILDLL